MNLDIGHATNTLNDLRMRVNVVNNARHKFHYIARAIFNSCRWYAGVG